MELADIGKLVAQYEAALLNEYEAKTAWLAAHNNVEFIEARALTQAYDAGIIDGKNAEARKLQSLVFLADSGAVGDARDIEQGLENKASLAEIERKRVDALLSLTRAWLYAQSGIPRR